MKDKITSEINAEQEVLSVMPLKTKKNKIAYQKALEDLEKKWTRKEKELKNEISARCEDIKNIYESEDINEINIKITNLGTDLYLINNYEDSFEKLGLDRVTYGLNHFYKENLIRVNKLILKAINLFSEVGIELTPAYFDYSHYTYEYMKVFYNEIASDLKSEKIRDTFEKIYWKCPEIITHLDLNIRYLFYLNEDKIDEYFKAKKADFLTKQNKQVDKIIEDYNNLIKQKDAIILEDAALILKDFISKKLNINDYEEAKLNKAYDKLLIDKDYYNQNKELVNDNIFKLEYSLKEYRDYLTFKFIIDDIKKKYQEKESYKNLRKNKLKEITKDEDNLRKKNYKIFKMQNDRIPNKDKIEAELNETEAIINGLKIKYDELEDLNFKDKVLNLITPTSTYYDILSLALANYSYLTTLIKKDNSEITEDEIKLKFYKLQTLVNSPYNTIINNISILDEKNISNIIIDRYRLLNININNENISEDSLEDTITTVHNITTYQHIKNSSITVDNVKFVVDVLPIIKTNN